MNRVGIIRCLVAAALFGVSAPATSLLARDMPSLVLAGLLYVGAALAVLLPALRTPLSSDAVRLEWRRLSVAVVAGGAVGPALLVAGIARTSAATASILLNLELLATVVLAATIFREFIGRRLVFSAVLVAGGGVLLVWQPGAQPSVGALLIGAACLAWGFDNGVTASIEQISPEHVVLLKGVVAGSVNIVLGLTIVGSAGIGAGSVMAALLVGAIGYGLSITLWVKGARELGAARGQMIFAAAPFMGALVAWVVLGESVSTIQLVAVILAAAGVMASLGSSHNHAHQHVAKVHDHEHSHNDDHHHHGHLVQDQEVEIVRRHSGQHRHQAMVHAHAHVPDLHHRHDHHQ